MSRILVVIILTLFSYLSVFSQGTVPAKSEQVQPAYRGGNPSNDKAAYIASITPNITMNGANCSVKDVSILRNSVGKYSTRIRFSENCSGQSEAIIVADNLDNAIEVKNLISSFQLYESFNLFSKKDEPLSFEVIYKVSRGR